MATETIDTAFPAAIANGKIHGAVLLATDAAGNFTYNGTQGSRTLVSGDKVATKSDDVLFLASATKLITTIAALQCVEDGLLTLKGNLPEALAPELVAKQVLVPAQEEGQEPTLEPAAHPITLEMLLTHSAGTSYDFLVPSLTAWKAKNMAALQPGDRRPVEEAFNHPLGYQPGTSWMYGPGLDFAGRIVERLTGKTLGENFQQRIFTPLGIEDGQFHPVTREDLRARMADLNPDDLEGLGRAVVAGNADMNLRSQGDFGGQGLFLPGSDYLKILRSLLANDGKILKRETVDDMFEHHLSPEASAGQQAALGSSPAGVLFGVGVNAFSPTTKVGHGLGGLLTLEDVEGWYGERTLTWGGGLTFAWFVDRKNDICGLAAVLDAPPYDMVTPSELKDTFRHDIYRKYAAWKKEQQS